MFKGSYVALVTPFHPDGTVNFEKLKELGGVATRRGSFCAHPYVWRLMGIPDDEVKAYEGCEGAFAPGMIRISFGIYNTEEEVDEFLEILPKAIEAAKNVDTSNMLKPVNPEF